MSVIDLLHSIEAAYAEVQAKAAVRDETAKAHQAAVEAHQLASEALAKLREEISAVLGNVLPQADPRFRKSA